MATPVFGTFVAMYHATKAQNAIKEQEGKILADQENSIRRIDEFIKTGENVERVQKQLLRAQKNKARAKIIIEENKAKLFDARVCYIPLIGSIYLADKARGKMLTLATFFKCFIYDPASPFLDAREKKIARIASRILSPLKPLCKKRWKSQKMDLIVARTKEINQRSHSASHQILNNLFLGQSDAFVDSTHLTFYHPDKTGRSFKKSTSNAQGFDSLISLCPMQAIHGDFPGLQDLEKEAIAHSLKEHDVKWLNVGKTTMDSPDGWLSLVHDCTLIETADAQVELHPAFEIKDLATLQERKAEAIQKEKVADWFKPVFAEMDNAVFSDRKVLVHCQAGASRSASVVAAYLINRFGMTTDQALDFLKIQRPVVKSKFIEQLRQYEEQLKS